MNDVQTWFEIAKYIGAGGAFVLGVGCWKIWVAYRDEVTYSRTRDRETLTVLAAIAEVNKSNDMTLTMREDRLLAAINELKSLILDRNRRGGDSVIQ